MTGPLGHVFWFKFPMLCIVGPPHQLNSLQFIWILTLFALSSTIYLRVHVLRIQYYRIILPLFHFRPKHKAMFLPVLLAQEYISETVRWKKYIKQNIKSLKVSQISICLPTRKLSTFHILLFSGASKRHILLTLWLLKTNNPNNLWLLKTNLQLFSSPLRCTLHWGAW